MQLKAPSVYSLTEAAFHALYTFKGMYDSHYLLLRGSVVGLGGLIQSIHAAQELLNHLYHAFNQL